MPRFSRRAFLLLAVLASVVLGSTVVAAVEKTATILVSVSYESDLRLAIRVIEEASSRLPELLPGKTIEAPKVMGIETIDDSCLRIRIETKVLPGCHYDVKRTLHLLLVESFNAHKLEIPYPKSVEVPFSMATGPEEKEAA